MRCAGSSVTFVFFLLLDFITRTVSECAPPIFIPRNGTYAPMKENYIAGDEIKYKCDEGFWPSGGTGSLCLSNGSWTGQMPFCDREQQTLWEIRGETLFDKKTTACRTGGKGGWKYGTHGYFEESDISVKSVRVFIKGSGPMNISLSIPVGNVNCVYPATEVEEGWVSFQCNNEAAVSKFAIFHTPDLCEVEVYGHKVTSCGFLPEEIDVPSGQFIISREVAMLRREDSPNKDIMYYTCDNGIWVKTGNQTGKECAPPIFVPRNGAYAPIKEHYMPGDEITYTCDKGFSPSGGTGSLCLSNGSWTGQMPFCDGEHLTYMDRGLGGLIDKNTTTCPRFDLSWRHGAFGGLEEPDIFEKSSDISVKSVRVFIKGSGRIRIAMHTELGFVICVYLTAGHEEGWVSPQCNGEGAVRRFGIFTTVEVCEIEVYGHKVTSCGYLPEETAVPSGQFIVSREMAILRSEDSDNKDIRCFTCKSGKWRITGNLACKGCAPPTFIPLNGAYAPMKQNYMPGDEIQYTCDEGFSPSGETGSLCLSNGSWTGLMPFCDGERLTHFGLLWKNLTDKNTATCVKGLYLPHFASFLEESDISVKSVRFFFKGINTVTISLFTPVRNVKCEYFPKGAYGNNARWVSIQCDSEAAVSIIAVFTNADLCEIEVYGDKMSSCGYVPKETGVPSGRFMVSREVAILRNEDSDNKDVRCFTCKNGTWDITGYQACKECEPPIFIPRNGTYTPVKEKYMAGDEIQYTCEKGFWPSDGTRSFCLSNGSWTRQTPFCDGKYLPPSEAMHWKEIYDKNISTCVPGKSVITPKFPREDIFAESLILYTKGGSTRACGFSSTMVGMRMTNFCFTILKGRDISSLESLEICEAVIYARNVTSCTYLPDEVGLPKGQFIISREEAILKCEGSDDQDVRYFTCKNGIWETSNNQMCQGQHSDDVSRNKSYYCLFALVFLLFLLSAM